MLEGGAKKMNILNININTEVLRGISNVQLECMRKYMDQAKRKADQNVIDDEVVGNFYDQFEKFQKIYTERKRRY